jgi:hypothetical protein
MSMLPNLKRKRSNPATGETVKKPMPLPRLRIILLLLLLAASLALVAILSKRLVTTKSTLKVVEKQKQAAMVDATEPVDAKSESPKGVWYGLCTKDTVHSIADFREAVNSDPLLTKHFADLNWDKARMGRLERDTYAHLAYRKNERIWTTRRLVRLPKGDGYITDGNRWIRTYCCNDYVVGPVRPYDVMDTDLNRLVDRADNTSKEVPGIVPPNETVPVPEPATLLLTGAGLTFFGIFRRRRNHKINP